MSASCISLMHKRPCKAKYIENSLNGDTSGFSFYVLNINFYFILIIKRNYTDSTQTLTTVLSIPL